MPEDYRIRKEIDKDLSLIGRQRRTKILIAAFTCLERNGVGPCAVCRAKMYGPARRTKDGRKKRARMIAEYIIKNESKIREN